MLGPIAALFFTSGATALLYQVAFGKKLATIFGATAYAVSAVLAAFMGGLALGSHLGGRYGRGVERPLRVYGIAEIAVGVVCAVTPGLFSAIESAYVAAAAAVPGSLFAVSAVRAVFTGAVVLVPTVAMGLTLPMLSRAVAGPGRDQERSRRHLGILYAVNTAGGAIGALAAAYWVLPLLGLAATMRAAAVVNVVIGVIAIVMGGDARIEAAAEARASTARTEPTLYLLAAASGFLVFASEVVDTHLLTLLIGNSAYAFGLMLAAFLTCLSLGAALAGPLDRRFGARTLPGALLVAALCLLLSTPIWGYLPRVFLGMGHKVFSWSGRELVRGVVAFVALCLPTTAMGLTFPLLLRRVAGEANVAQRVGQLTAINTLGSIAGALLSGYFILPALGSENMLRAVALGFVVAAAFTARTQVFRAGAALALVLAVLLPRWDMKLMTNGANVYFDTYPVPDELVFVREDVHGGLTSVARNAETLTMYTNGKFQGNNGAEVTAQRSFAHFPAMFVPTHDHALVIGLGTGTTLGTIAAYPFRRIDVAEISPAIVQAARSYFADINGRALDDDRVRLLMNDGRNVLLLSTDRYDLITIELTSVWFAGAANLYSDEFYRVCRERLGERGVLQQWVQLHHIHRRELAVVLRTLRARFEHVALFVSGGQGIVVASAHPLTVESARLDAMGSWPAVKATLGGASLRGLLDRLLLSGEALDRFIADSEVDGGPQLSTDDNLYLEHATPKGNVMSYERSLRETVELLQSYRAPDPLAEHLR